MKCEQSSRTVPGLPFRQRSVTKAEQFWELGREIKRNEHRSQDILVWALLTYSSVTLEKLVTLSLKLLTCKMSILRIKLDVIKALCILTHLTFTSYEVGTILIPIFEMRKQWAREDSVNCQDYSSGKKQRRDWKAQSDFRSRGFEHHNILTLQQRIFSWHMIVFLV